MKNKTQAQNKSYSHFIGLRIEDDDSEYDSEMDDFIDDGDEEEDVSSHIRAIFGYDKQKYVHTLLQEIQLLFVVIVVNEFS